MAGVGARSRRTAATRPIGDPMRVRRQEAFGHPNSFGADPSLRIGFLLQCSARSILGVPRVQHA